MKAKICLLLMLCAAQFGFSQIKYEWGEDFEYDVKTETQPEIVLADSYNYYLLTVPTNGGVKGLGQFILRKFDQKNVLVDTYSQDLPSLDSGTLTNYLGFLENGNGKVVIFVQSYSNKAKKSAIYRLEFDKATAKLSAVELTSAPILSLMKSGTVTLKKSQNGRFMAIVYEMHRAKEEAEKSLVLMFDTASQEILWQKEFAFTDNYFTKHFAVTESGNIVFLRLVKGFKKHNYLVLGTKEGERVIEIDSEIMLQEPVAIAINSQDYILALNSNAKGIRSGDFANLLLFDLQNAKTIQNSKVDFNSIKDIKDVQILKATVEGNEIRFFTEAKVQLDIKASVTAGGGFAPTPFPSDMQRFGPSSYYVLGLDGTILSEKKLSVDVGSPAELYHSFGLAYIKGNYYVNTGRHSGFYPLESNGGNNQSINLYRYARTSYQDENIRYVNQLVRYFPDSNRVIFARIKDGSKMSFVSVFGLQ